MNLPKTIRNALIALCVVAPIGAAVGGVVGALGTLASGLLMVANLWLLWLGSKQLTHTGANPVGIGVLSVLLVVKAPFILVAFALLLSVVGPVPVVLGLSSGVIALMAHAATAARNPLSRSRPSSTPNPLFHPRGCHDHR